MKTQWCKLLFILLLLVYACNNNKNELKSEEKHYEDPQNAGNFIKESDSNYDGNVFVEDTLNAGEFIEQK